MTPRQLLKHARMRAKEPFQILAATLLTAGLDRRLRWVSDLAGFEPKSIVTSRTDRIGDLLVSSPLLWALHQRWPSARLVLIPGPKNRSVLEGLPFVEAGPVFRREPASWVEVWRWVWRQRFDMAVALRAEAMADVVVAAASRAPVRAVTHATKMLAAFNLLFGAEGRHHVLRYCAAAERLGVPCEPRPVFVLSEEAKRKGAEGLEQLRRDHRGPLVGFQMPNRADHHHQKRAWSLDKVIRLTRELTADGVRVVLCGTGSERTDAELVRAAVPEAVLAPKVSLATHGAILQGLDLFISNLTGSLHLADAVGTPTVTYTRTDFGVFWPPVGPQHRLVIGPHFPDISPDAVLAAARDCLAERRR